MKNRKTLGLIINSIDGSYQTLLWLAFKKAAEELDCNLLVFEGRTLREAGYAPKQHHIVYSFVEKGKLDGLIITTSSILINFSQEELIKFFNKYKDIPKVSFGIKIPQAISLLSNSKEGMKDVIRHLIKDHGYKKIIFVKGPENFEWSVERFSAYKEVLEENNISFDETLVFSGDFVADTGYKVMQEIILMEIDYDAIVFANDDMALGAIKCIESMKEAGKCSADKKSIICGFDDSLNASQVTPRLTTVRQPIKEMCYKAVELLVKGESEEQTIEFPCVMVKRESCGCSYNKENDDIENNMDVKLAARFRAHESIQSYQIDELFDRLTTLLKHCFIKSCFIFKYVEGPIFYDVEMAFDESFEVPKTSELIYAFCDGERRSIDEEERIIMTTSILPESFINYDRRFTHLVLPLFFKNEHLGYTCFEGTDNNDVMIFELLRGQISNTLKGALMLMERERIEESLRENERLASLGQLIGGISHNLMTPIMSIAGLAAALEDLNNEYRDSIGDESVTIEDHLEINSEMGEWIEKLKEYNSYMSSVISTVKSQAVQLNAQTNNSFTINELTNRIKFLRNSDIIIRKSDFSLFVDADSSIVILGDISNIIQILDNLIKNAIESYTRKELHECRVELGILKKENMIIITVKDFGVGIPDEVKSRIFKYIVTTKGKTGNGVSLMLSYSTIKGKFGGEIWFESKINEGTEFFIALPIAKDR
jgi:DNA-binding LacI/PurR family transcriptional regulator/signal transduction histidine kinase